VGVLTDRTRRTALLAASIVAWAAAIFCCGLAQSYHWLLITRIALGAVSATAGPTIASLVGDFFPAADRGRMYGLILGGDLVGTGIGFVVSGDISSALSWRFAFWWLALPGVVLAWLAWRLPEPARGGASQLAHGAEDVPDPRAVRAGRPSDGNLPAGEPPGGAPGRERAAPGAPADGPRRDTAAKAVQDAGIAPQPGLVLHEDPTGRSLWWAVRYVLRVRTNLIIIIASALGYFFFTGLRSFSTLYVTGHYGLHKPVADALLLVIGVGALAGVFAGGRVSDRLLHQGNVRGRIIVPTVCLFALVPVMAPAIATDSVALALPLFVLGAFLLGAPNPPLDAARLDIIHPRLWGRAEGVRTVLRTLGEAGAPLLFGYISQYVFGGPGASAGNSGSGAVHTGDARGLEYTFLIFLVPLLAAAILALAALRTYPRDVATATASREAISRAEQRQAARSRPPERRR
jgi:MFS family permease